MYRISRRQFIKGLTAVAAFSTSPAFLAKALQAPHPPRIAEEKKEYNNSLFINGKYIGELYAINGPYRQNNYTEITTIEEDVRRYESLITSIDITFELREVSEENAKLLGEFFHDGDIIGFEVRLLDDMNIAFDGYLTELNVSLLGEWSMNEKGESFYSMGGVGTTLAVRISGPVTVEEV